jgi:hypothetical protein
MKKLPERWFMRTTCGLLVGWVVVVHFWLGPWANRGYGDPGDDHITPGAAIFLYGLGGIFWLVGTFFKLPPSPPDDNPNIS